MISLTSISEIFTPAPFSRYTDVFYSFLHSFSFPIFILYVFMVSQCRKWRKISQPLQFGKVKIDPLGRPTITAVSDHYFHKCHPSAPTFQNSAKQPFSSGIVSPAEGIIDDTCLVITTTVHQFLNLLSLVVINSECKKYRFTKRKTRQMSSMIHSARPTVLPDREHCFHFVLFW